MPKVEWGKKVVCTSCEIKFYDLNRKYPLLCPSCDAKVEELDSNIIDSNAKKVFTSNVDTSPDENLVGRDAAESTVADDVLPINDEENEDTISLEEVDNDEVGVIEAEVNDIEIEGGENPIEIEEE